MRVLFIRPAALCNESVLIFRISSSLVHDSAYFCGIAFFVSMCCLFVYLLLGSCGRISTPPDSMQCSFIFRIITVVTIRVSRVLYICIVLLFWQQQLIFRSIPFSVRLLDVQAGRLVCLAEMTWRNEKGKRKEKKNQNPAPQQEK